MIIYLIKLTLILIFNTCVSIYYINSECKCCCGNSKSGEISGGNKINLGTNPLKSIKPKPVGHIGEMRSGSKGNLGTNQRKGLNPKPVGHFGEMRSGGKCNLSTNQRKGLNPKPVGHIGEMRSGGKCNLSTNLPISTNPLFGTNPPKSIKPPKGLNQPKGPNSPVTTHTKVKPQIKDFLNIEININDAIIQVTNVNKETKNFTKISEKTPTINNITYGIYSSITNLYEFDEEIFNCITNDSEITITGVELPSYILFAVLTESNEYYLGLCKNGVSQTDNVEKRGIFEGMEGNYNIKILGIGDSLDSFFAMFYRSKIKNVTFVKSVNTQKVKNMMYMFDGCKSLKELNLSNFNTSNVTAMQYMFKDCSSLTSLRLPDKVIYVGVTSDMFNGCDKLSKKNVRTKDINILNMILKK